MRLSLVLSAAVLVLLSGGAPAAEMPEPCLGRERCQMVKTHNAGTGADGEQISLVETRVASPPGTEPFAACGRTQDVSGGQEYWRLVMGKKDKSWSMDSQPVLTICNDGYGAAGVGQDTVTVSANTLRRVQSGGSADRWEREETLNLSPLYLKAWRECGWYNGTGDSYATAGSADPFIVRSWWAEGKKGVEPHCPDTSDPKTATGLVLPVVPVEGGVPEGTSLGSCAMDVTDRTGFYIVGKPGKAFFRTVATDDGGLYVQVQDPALVNSAKSWVRNDHVEVWVFDPVDQTEDAGFWQIGVLPVEGTVVTGYGKPAALPKVRRWTTTEAGQPVTVLHLQWPGLEYLTGQQGTAQVAVLYSDSDTGERQDRLLGTVPVKYADARTLGGTAHMPLTCGVRNGRLDVIRNDQPNLMPLP
ncbi:MAG: hypothetical protein M3O22_07310 [Pseudomonadota bacterium]|nr:hypothetical protein [Pseudomonadota bacterium]